VVSATIRPEVTWHDQGRFLEKDSDEETVDQLYPRLVKKFGV
jgi:hypothetical protein